MADMYFIASNVQHALLYKVDFPAVAGYFNLKAW